MKDTGGPAYPSTITEGPEGRSFPHDFGLDGMTLLDWFAGEVAPKVFMAVTQATKVGVGMEKLLVGFELDTPMQLVGRLSYDAAASLIAEKRRREAD